MNCLFLIACAATAPHAGQYFQLISANVARADSPALPEIGDGWKFRIGDDPTWSQTAADDSDWRSIRVGDPWEKQGVDDYDGYAWYRLRISIPIKLREDPRLNQHQTLKVTLGKIDDVDQTWFNGEQIGNTGRFPEAYRPAWQTPRVYLIPAALIRWNDENIIAVRVYDDHGHGGMVEGPYKLQFAGWSDLLDVQFDLGRGDGICDGSQLPIAVTLRNKSNAELSGKINWTVEDDEGTKWSTESTEATIPAHGTVPANCHAAPDKAGFYRVTCALESDQHDRVKAASKILGLRPEELQSPLTRAPDFDEFWQQTLNSLSSVPAEFAMTHKPQHDSDTHAVYEVEMRSLGGVRVRGWYQRPKAGRAHAALLRLPGYGEIMRPLAVREPLAVFSFNIRGHGNSQHDVSGKPKDYWIRGLDDKQDYFYLGAYADCVRAVDFLTSRPEVDKTRVAVTGGSQGGGLSLVTAALDHRISLCAVDIPFLCNWVKYFKTTNWPEMNQWVSGESHRTWDSTLRTMSYFDALNFADRIRCPVLFAIGLQDDVCPPATIFSVYNRLAGPKEYCVYPHAGHGVGPAHNDLRRQWISRHFGLEKE